MSSSFMWPIERGETSYPVAPKHHAAAAPQRRHAPLPIRREQHLDESIGRRSQFRAVAVPPALRDPRQAVDINVFYVNHFEKAKTRVRASPSARAAPAVRRLRDAVI